MKVTLNFNSSHAFSREFCSGEAELKTRSVSSHNSLSYLCRRRRRNGVIMKKTHIKLLLIVLVLLLAATVFVACVNNTPVQTTECTEHKDADKDGKCDACGKTVEEETCTDHIDVDEDNYCEICGAQIAFPVEVTVTVKDEKGNPMSGISVTLDHETRDSVTEITDEEGKIKISVLPSSYSVGFEGLADGWYVDGTGKTIEISASALSFDFTAIDNNPDGSEEKPYFVGDEAVEKTFAAGVTYNFSAKGASKYLVVNNENAKVTYDGKEYLPEDGVIRVHIAETDVNSTTLFAVTNTADVDNTISICFESLPGSQGNPFDAELDTVLSATVKVESTVYYNWTAAKSGYLVLTSDTVGNYIMMYDLTSYVVTSYTDGAKSICLRVTQGDKISIAVATKSTADQTQVDFKLEMFDGTEASPIPLYETAIYRLPANTAVSFIYHGEDKSVTLAEYGLEVLLGGESVAAGNGAYVFDVTEGSVITVKLTAEELTEIVFTVS